MDGSAAWLRPSRVAPVSNPAAGMEVRGNSGFEPAETHWTLGFEEIRHFGFILKPSLAEPGRI